MTKSIPFFNYPALFEKDEEKYVEIFKDVCKRGAYILQRDLDELEDNLKKFLNVKYAFGVADGTNALILGLKALDIGAGDEVIVPSHTYIASAASVYLVGGTPVLCDIGDDNLIDPDDIERHITSRTKAIMPVHVNGRTCDMDKVTAVAKKHNLMIVEDAAQALGSKFKNQSAGTFGKFGTFSFYPAKVLGCFGDGGALVTNDDAVAERVFALRDHGRNKEGIVLEWGTNSRLDNLQAAFLNFKLSFYPDEMKRRREIAKMYHEEFSKISALKLPPAPVENGDHYDIYQNYEFAAERRDELRLFLKEKGISTIIQWAGTPVHQFNFLNYKGILKNTDVFFEKCLLLPMNTSLSNEDVNYIISSVREFYEN